MTAVVLALAVGRALRRDDRRDPRSAFAAATVRGGRAGDASARRWPSSRVAAAARGATGATRGRSSSPALLAPGCSQILFTPVDPRGRARRGRRSRSGRRRSSRSRSRSSSSTSRSGSRSRSARSRSSEAGSLLARERDRPAHLRAIGLAVRARRDAFCSRSATTLVRALHGHADPGVGGGGDAPRGDAGRARRRLDGCRRRGEAAPVRAGRDPFGLSYLCLFEAYFHGRVSVVSPLVATESLWGVGLAALAFGRAEGVGSRVARRRGSVVLGGALIGAFR